MWFKKHLGKLPYIKEVLNAAVESINDNIKIEYKKYKEGLNINGHAETEALSMQSFCLPASKRWETVLDSDEELESKTFGSNKESKLREFKGDTRRDVCRGRNLLTLEKDKELFKRICSLAHIPEAIGRELLTREAAAYRQRHGIKQQQSNSSVGSDTAHAT